MPKMETLMENKQISPQYTTPSTRSLNKNSQTISKPKPKIRIIHIFAPEIIKTDAENFRELVQRLTGKPTSDSTKKKLPRTSKPRKPSSSNKKNMDLALRAGGFREMIKGEEEIWTSANSGGGFLGGFGDQFDGIMQEINEQFPFVEGTTQMGAYGILYNLLTGTT